MAQDMLWVVIMLIGLAIVFDFMNGFHDAANSIATIVSTGVLKPAQAVVFAAFFNFVAVFVFHNLHVAATVGKGIVLGNVVDTHVIFGALIGAIIWSIITWFYGIPSSSSHALIGGLVGAVLCKSGWNALVWGGQLQMALLPPALAQAQVKAGKLRAIGVTSAGRSALAPDVPSLAEAGIQNFELEIWNAFAAPATMPKALQVRLAKVLADIARTPEVRAKLFQQGWQVAGTSPEGLANRIKADTAALGQIIAQRGIKAE